MLEGAGAAAGAIAFCLSRNYACSLHRELYSQCI